MPRGKRPTVQQKETAKVLLAEGKSIRDVAKETGISNPTVHKIGKENVKEIRHIRAKLATEGEITARNLVEKARTRIAERLDDPEKVEKVKTWELNKIIDTHDKIDRLDRDAPTDITRGDQNQEHLLGRFAQAIGVLASLHAPELTQRAGQDSPSRVRGSLPPPHTEEEDPGVSQGAVESPE